MPRFKVEGEEFILALIGVTNFNGVCIRSVSGVNLDTLPGNDITTKHGYHLSDFDKWDFTEERFYMPATSQPDNRMDCCYRHCPSTVSDMVQSRLTGACLMPECTSIHWLWTAELWIQNA